MLFDLPTPYSANDGIALNTYPAMKKNEKYTVPNDTKSIYSDAFEENRYLKELTIPDSVQGVIGLPYVSALETLNLGKNCWLDCITATRFSMDPEVLDALEGTYSLKAINVADGNVYQSSADGVLYNNDKTELLRYPIAKNGNSFTVPATVKKIADFAFGMYVFDGADIDHLAPNGAVIEHELPEGSVFVTLESVSLPEGLEEIGESAFEYCTKLKTITIPDSVKRVKPFAFRDTDLPKDTDNCVYNNGWLIQCLKITGPDTNIELDVKAGTKHIADAAFHQVLGRPLARVTLPASLETIGMNPFVALPTSSYDNLESDIYYENKSEVKAVSVDTGNTCFKVEDGILYGVDNGQKKEIIFSNGGHSGEFTVADSIEKIDEFAFYNDDSEQLDAIIVPDSVKYIGFYPLPHCSRVVTESAPYNTEIRYLGAAEQWNNILTTALRPYKICRGNEDALLPYKFMISEEDFITDEEGIWEGMPPLFMECFIYDYESMYGSGSIQSELIDYNTDYYLFGLDHHYYIFLPKLNIQAASDPTKLNASVKFPGKEGVSSSKAVCTLTPAGGTAQTIGLPYKTADGGAKLSADVDPAKNYDVLIELPGCLPYHLAEYKPGTTALPSNIELYAGDININSDKTVGDGAINAHDQAALTACFGKKSTDTGYRAEADFNKDDVINAADRSEIVKNFGKQSTAA